jgi:hypothetical protein
MWSGQSSPSSARRAATVARASSTSRRVAAAFSRMQERDGLRSRAGRRSQLVPKRTRRRGFEALAAPQLDQPVWCRLEGTTTRVSLRLVLASRHCVLPCAKRQGRRGRVAPVGGVHAASG